MPFNPCVECGACCAFFRASFYWAEAADGTPGGFPVELTEKLTPFMRVIKGTNQPSPRCVCLEGLIGSAVRCVEYATRPSPCRDFLPSYQDGVHNERCDNARAAHGMRPLTPDDWFEPMKPTDPEFPDRDGGDGPNERPPLRPAA
jgi:Fe-S-cluster containining protein